MRATCPSFFFLASYFSAYCFFFTMDNYLHSAFNPSLSVSRFIHLLLNRDVTCIIAFSIQRNPSLNASLVFMIKRWSNYFRHFIDTLQQVHAHAKAAAVYVNGGCLSRHLQENSTWNTWKLIIFKIYKPFVISQLIILLWGLLESN
jgi:hypothetical protein